MYDILLNIAGTKIKNKNKNRGLAICHREKRLSLYIFKPMGIDAYIMMYLPFFQFLKH